MRSSLLPLVFFLFCGCHAASNTLTLGQSIQDGQTLVSPLETFVLGFFSPKHSTNRYVGIWYKNISVRTYVWVANRENPVKDSSGVFTLGSDGNLVVVNGNGRSLWSSNVSSALNNVNLTAALMDTGNLILCFDANVEELDTERILWESFEAPTDTFLPGKRVWVSPRRSKDLFVSWKSESDLSKGNFSVGLNPEGLMEIVVWEGLQRRWRSGLYNGQTFIGVPGMTAANYLYGFKVQPDAKGTFFKYIVTKNSELVQFHIRWDGTLEELRWNAEQVEWTTYWAEPTRTCELYNTCGSFGKCSAFSSTICSCLRGFVPKIKTEWDNGNWSGGCVRRRELQCDKNVSVGGEQDQFLELDGLKLPDFSVFIQCANTSDCRDICLNNCSCKAYAYVDGIQCLMWFRDLMDIQKFRDGGQTLYVRLAASEISNNKSRVRIVIIVAAVLSLVVACISAFIFWNCNANNSKQNGEEEVKSTEFQSPISQNFYTESNRGDGSELTVHNFQEIMDATDNFSSSNKLGEGGFGPVYRGKLLYGMDVAVKRLSRRSGQGSEEFMNEITLIAKLQHRNLVRLLGYCFDEEEKMLVYEYMPNKSLDAFVFGNPGQHLDWGKRFNIIEGITRGLLYLHRDSRLRIIHRDLKVSNILLDAEMNPKISDFGMAKIFGGNDCEENTKRVVGTYGYMAPEYAMEGLFSVKSDVYSFGVVILEIISGKKNNYLPEYSTNLVGYAWKLWGEERTIEFIDESVRDSCLHSDALRCINVGLLCVQDSTTDRPTVSTVVLMLERETVILPAPCKPSFPVKSNRTEIESDMDSSGFHPRNSITNTLVVGR